MQSQEKFCLRASAIIYVRQTVSATASLKDHTKIVELTLHSDFSERRLKITMSPLEARHLAESLVRMAKYAEKM